MEEESPNSSEILGKIARLLIDNHNKSKVTTKADIASAVGISSRKVVDTMVHVGEYLSKFQLEIARLPKDKTGKEGEELSDKYFLRKESRQDAKRARIEPGLAEKRLYTVLAAIQIENGVLDESKLSILAECVYFHGMDISAYAQSLKKDGYLSAKSEEGRVTWSLGWRAQLEFEPGFRILDCFEDDIEAS